MANVTATDAFFDDPRFDTAGVLLGVDGDLVRMKMERLWSWQTERYTPETPSYVVGRTQIVGIFKMAGAPEALVEAGLAEERPGGYYIRGTEGVIEWLWKKKAAGAKGYAKRSENRSALGVPEQTLGTPAGGAPVVSSPCDPRSEIRDPESEDQYVPASPADAHKPDPVGDLWAEQERLRSDAVPGSRALTLTATRRKAIGRLLAAGYSTDDLRVCLVQYATEAKLRPASRQWFNGETNWVEANVARTLGRVGAPEATGPPANSHRPIRGQAPVSTAQHFDGDVPL